MTKGPGEHVGHNATGIMRKGCWQGKEQRRLSIAHYKVTPFELQISDNSLVKQRQR
jgi:hypothetical protein